MSLAGIEPTFNAYQALILPLNYKPKNLYPLTVPRPSNHLLFFFKSFLSPPPLSYSIYIYSKFLLFLLPSLRRKNLKKNKNSHLILILLYIYIIHHYVLFYINKVQRQDLNLQLKVMSLAGYQFPHFANFYIKLYMRILYIICNVLHVHTYL